MGENQLGMTIGQQHKMLDTNEFAQTAKISIPAMEQASREMMQRQQEMTKKQYEEFQSQMASIKNSYESQIKAMRDNFDKQLE